MSQTLSQAGARVVAAVALLRRRARASRRAALAMDPSPAKTALERIAARWDLMAEAERRGDVLRPANEA